MVGIGGSPSSSRTGFKDAMGSVLLMRSRVLAAVCCVGVALAAMVASGGWRASGVSAQAPVDYDTDDDGLIEMNY